MYMCITMLKIELYFSMTSIYIISVGILIGVMLALFSPYTARDKSDLRAICKKEPEHDRGAWILEQFRWVHLTMACCLSWARLPIETYRHYALCIMIS